MKYQKRIHWDRYRPEFLKIGFIFALAITLMAFNYTSSPTIYEPFELEDVLPDLEVIPPATVHPKKKVIPPPPPPKKLDVVKIEPTTEPIVEFKRELVIEKKENVIVDEYANDPIPNDAPIVDIVKEEEKEDESPLLFAERMPVYIGCDTELSEAEKRDCTSKKLLEHAYKHVDYPETAKHINLEGTVVVSFVVNKNGEVQNIEIMKDIGMGCGDEVRKSIEKLGKFLPGKQNGRPVSVVYRLPVHFKLY